MRRGCLLLAAPVLAFALACASGGQIRGESLHLDLRPSDRALVRPGWVTVTGFLRGDDVARRPKRYLCLVQDWTIGQDTSRADELTCTQEEPQRMFEKRIFIRRDTPIRLQLRDRRGRAIADGFAYVQVIY